MISQRYRTHRKIECPAINQCVATAKTSDSMFIVTGDIDHNVTLYDEQLHKVQEIPFKGWIRCCEVFDVDNNGNQEIAIGSGDNSVRIFRYEEETGYSELWRYDFDNKVTTLSIGDINYDGRAEVIAGGWDNSLKVFDGLTGVLLWELDFDDWVTLAKVLDVNHDGLPEVVVGLKKGQLGVINGIDGTCLWDYQFEKRINSCELVHLANNEFPHLLVGGDESILYIFDFDGNLVNQIPTPDRVLCISQGDINNNNYNEVLVTCADKRLYVYESEDTGFPENTSLKLRWKATLGNVGTGLTISNYFQDNVPRIIVTGYSKDLRILEDFFYGADKLMENSRHLTPKLSNHEEKLRALLGPDVDIEFYDHPEAFFFPKKIETLNQLIPSNFKSKSESYTFMNLKSVYENKCLLELQMANISQEIADSSRPMVVLPSKISNLDQISDFTDTIPITPGLKKAPSIRIAPTNSSQGGDLSIPSNPRDKFIHILQNTDTISSKAKMQVLMEENGLSKDEFNDIFNQLKEKEGILKYSRSAPRGYTLSLIEPVSENKEIPIKTPEKTTKESKAKPTIATPSSKASDATSQNEKFLNLVKKNQPISSKAKLLELAESIEIGKKSAESIINQLKELGILSYSRSSPRGWSAK